MYTNNFNLSQKLIMTELNKQPLTSKLRLKTILTKQNILKINTWSL